MFSSGSDQTGVHTGLSLITAFSFLCSVGTMLCFNSRSCGQSTGLT